MSKRLILVRHAHRDTDEGRELDNGLSAKGKKQRKLLNRFLAAQKGIEHATLMSSPSTRCMETLAPLAKKYALELEETPVLIEQQAEESWKQFERRVRYFCATWKKSGLPLTIVCTHGDWIPAAVFSLVGVGIELKKSGIVVLHGEKRDVQLETLIQNFSFLKK